MKPDDVFWPLRKYWDKFGDPDSAANRKRGHRVSTIKGHHGVIVPHDDDPDKPWKIRREAGSKVVKKKENDIGSDSDSSEAKRQFNNITHRRREEYREVCTGVCASVLANLEFTQEEKDNEAAKAHAKTRKIKSRAKAGASKTKTCLSGFARLVEDSDIAWDSDSASGTGSAKNASSNHKTPVTHKTRVNVTNSSSSVAKGEVVAHGSQAEINPNPNTSPPGSRVGRPDLDIVCESVKLWSRFLVADDQSEFFDPEVCTITKRLIARWNGRIIVKLASTPPGAEDHSALVLARKK